jgi:hypothetical protein
MPDHDETVNTPPNMDVGASADQIPPKMLGEALESFLDQEGGARAPEGGTPFNEFTDPSAPTPAQPSNPTGKEMDPLNPGGKIWQALEQEAADEEKEKLHKSQLHHPEPPEELPDISNL